MAGLVYQQLGPHAGGMNASLSPIALPEGQFARGVNISVRGGFVRTRPGFHCISYDIPGDITPDTDTFQGAEVWYTEDGTYIATVFSGVVRITDVSDGSTTVIGPLLGSTDPVFIVQAGPFLAFHGGPSPSLLVLEWSGGAAQVKMSPTVPHSLLSDPWDTQMQSTAIHSDVLAEMESSGHTYAVALGDVLAALSLTTPSYPFGTISCFAHGRIHIATEGFNGRYFQSSDIMRSSDQSSVLRWWEDAYLNGGGGYGLPGEMGEIRGMAVMKNTENTASGYGPLVVLAQDGVTAFSVQLPREGTYDINLSTSGNHLSATAKLITPGWKDQQIGQVLYYGYGTESPWSLCRLNGDLVYRSHDGIRSLRSTLASTTGAVVANTSMSSEVKPFMDMDSGAADLDRVSAAAADNRVLMTVSRSGDGYKGLVALDTSVLSLLDRTVSTQTDAKYTAYDGIWTGATVGRVLTSKDTVYIVATDGRIYNIVDSQWDTVDGERRNIECQLMTRSLAFEKPGVPKTLSYVDLWACDLLGDVSVTMYFRPDNFPWWTPMDSTVEITAPGNLPPQERRRLRFKPNVTDKYTYDGSVVTRAESFQILVVWTGQLTVHRLLAAAYPQTESAPVSTETQDYANLERESDQVAQDDFSYPE